MRTRIVVKSVILWQICIICGEYFVNTCFFDTFVAKSCEYDKKRNTKIPIFESIHRRYDYFDSDLLGSIPYHISTILACHLV